jgi:hypothetical protein
MFKQDKGTAGLTILLSVGVMLFIIGLIVMIFSLMGSKMAESVYTETTFVVNNETTGSVNETGVTLLNSPAGYRNAVCSVTQASNGTGTYYPINSANYTISLCVLKFAGVSSAGVVNNTAWNVTYSVTYDADNDATRTMNDTTSSIAGVTDWFNIFIVITAMVVLILLTVIIITAIRSSGMVEGVGETSGAGKIGTA